MSALKDRIQQATQAAMRAREKPRVAALRLVNAEIKRLEVDERRALTDAEVTAVLSRMAKQRRESLRQYEAAGRQDLAQQEAFEIDLISSFLPAPIGEAALCALIDETIAAAGAGGMKDMGKVMAALRGKLAGRADMGMVSGKVKARLGAKVEADSSG